MTPEEATKEKDPESKMVFAVIRETFFTIDNQINILRVLLEHIEEDSKLVNDMQSSLFKLAKKYRALL